MLPTIAYNDIFWFVIQTILSFQLVGDRCGIRLERPDVTLDEVEDTDELSDNRTWARIEVKLHMVEANGRKKTTEKTAKCKTQASVVTDFAW